MVRGVGLISALVFFCFCLSVTEGLSLKLKKQSDSKIFVPNHDPSFSTHPPHWGYKQIGRSLPLGGGWWTVFGSYSLSLSIGQPPVSYNLLVDTGSSNTAIPGTNCPTCHLSSDHPAYSTRHSSTSTPLSCTSPACQRTAPRDRPGRSWTCANATTFGPHKCSQNNLCAFQITYGGGSSSLSGTLATDQMCVGSEGQQLCATSTFGVIEREYPEGFNLQSPVTGILGLASDFNSCNPTCVTPFFLNLAQQNHLPLLFSLCLSANKGGVLDLGEVDREKYEGEIKWAGMEVNRWYNIKVKALKLGSLSVDVPSFLFQTTNDVIGSFVDSGTSILLMGPSIFASFQSLFTSSFCSLPGICGDSSFFSGACFPKKDIDPFLNKYPTLNFTVAGEKGPFDLSLPPSSYLIPSYPDNQSYCLGIQAVLGIGIVFGDTFMQNYYIVHDLQNLRVGFAPVVPPACA